MKTKQCLSNKFSEKSLINWYTTYTHTHIHKALKVKLGRVEIQKEEEEGGTEEVRQKNNTETDIQTIPTTYVFCSIFLLFVQPVMVLQNNGNCFFFHFSLLFLFSASYALLSRTHMMIRVSVCLFEHCCLNVCHVKILSIHTQAREGKMESEKNSNNNFCWCYFLCVVICEIEKHKKEAGDKHIPLDKKRASTHISNTLRTNI